MQWNDLVSKDAVIDAVDKHTFETDEGLCLDEDISIILEDLPSAQPEQKRGRWIDGECSACGYGVEPWNNTPYCPNCGAYNEE